jgi:MFS family permease
VFYGWAVVAATFVMLTTSSGLGFYALTLYLRTLTDVGGFSVSSVSGATAVFFIVSGIVGVGVGRVIARHDPRPVIAVGAAVAAASLVAMGRAGSLWQVYLAYAGFGAGFAGCSLIISSTLVTRWFHRRRSVALSVSSTGLSVGGILLTPAATALIDQRGFATASLWIAAAFVVGVVPVTALVLRPGPSALGLLPDGDPSPAATGAGPAVGGGVPFAEAVRGTLFRRITVTWTLALIAQVGGISHLFSLVDERVDRPAAALAVSVLAGSSMVGRLAGGWLLGRVALRPACLTWLVLQACGLSGLALVEGRAGLLVSASLFGLSVGNVLLLQPVVLADVFGVRDYPRIFARSQLVSTVGIASGPFLLGILRDATDGYRLAFLAATALSLVASAVISTGGRLDRFEAQPARGGLAGS